MRFKLGERFIGDTRQSKTKEERKKTKDELRMEKAQKEKPPLSRILSGKEMEVSSNEIL